MRNVGEKIVTGIAEASLIGSSLTGAVARPNPVKEPEKEVEPVKETYPLEQESTEESESPFFVFDEDELPSILEEEEKAEAEISKPITDEEIMEVVDTSPTSTFGDPEMLGTQEEVTKIEELSKIPNTIEGINTTVGLYDGEFVELADYMSLSDLKSYEVERVELDGKLNVHSNSDQLTIITVPLRRDHFPEDYFLYTKANVDEYSRNKNQQKREDYYYNSQFEDIKGIGFSVDEIITLKGPSGDIWDFGKVASDSPTENFILMRSIRGDGQKKDYMSKKWENIDLKEYGYVDGWDFDKFVIMVLGGDIQENAEKFIEEQGIQDSERTGFSMYDKGLSTNVIKTTHEWREGLLYKLSDPENRQELSKIAEVNPKVKTVLGFVDAINSYPGDDVVTDSYLQDMYKFNRETYGVEPVGLNNKKYLPEMFTKYLLNYRDEHGDSWYDSFLEVQTGYYPFRNIEDLTKLLNLLSAGVKIEGQPAQPFAFLDLIDKFSGTNGPSLQFFPVRTISEIIPKEFMNSEQRDNFISIPNGWSRAYIYKRGWSGINKVFAGDLIIYPNAGGADSNGVPVGQVVKIFYVDDQTDPKNPIYWAVDLNDYEGKGRIYKWSDFYDPNKGPSYLLTTLQREIDD
ncbi:MAG: hypothetical protein XD87_0070 [candidate division WS6 bacterium 36_33]|uniref:Uncharacterized protein n=1 Tax=candidate division WS6 bacterium 36_33 TaxID=1641388 RepID=A0A101GZH7_9BACT|nr:MAG: hypothetical protein XD87_0070 [candidate division WS6 bacterium 36_33]